MSDLNDKLLPCPYCGGEAQALTDGSVECETNGCGARVWTLHTDASVARWNRRATPAPQAAPSDSTQQALHIVSQAYVMGWREGGDEGAWEFVTRTSYETGWKDAVERHAAPAKESATSGEVQAWKAWPEREHGDITTSRQTMEIWAANGVPFKALGYIDAPSAASSDAREGWKEAAIAWNVCVSIHREYAKGKYALFSKRQADFTKRAAAARAALSAAEQGGKHG